MANIRGKNTVVFNKKIIIKGFASAVGKKEGQGPLGSEFDIVGRDDKFGQKTFERAESQLQRMAVLAAISTENFKVSVIVD